MSNSVPQDLTETVTARYPATSVYADKSAMLTEHPPTQLDCYEIDQSRERARKNLGLRVLIFAALAIALCPRVGSGSTTMCG